MTDTPAKAPRSHDLTLTGLSFIHAIKEVPVSAETGIRVDRNLTETALAELKKLKSPAPTKAQIQETCANLVQQRVEQATPDQLQTLAKRCATHDQSEQITLLVKLQSDNRKAACQIAKAQESAELPALAAALAAMSPRARGEFIVEALGRDRLKAENPGTYERGIGAVMRLTSTPADTLAYLHRMQPGILKKMADRQYAADLAMTVVSFAPVVQEMVRKEAATVLRQSQVITTVLRSTVSGTLTKLLTAALEKYLLPKKENEVTAASAEQDPPTAAKANSTPSHKSADAPSDYTQRLTSFLHLTDSVRGPTISNKISREIMAIGLILLAQAREEEERAKKGDERKLLMEQAVEERTLHAILRHLDPTNDGALIELLRQNDFLPPTPFRRLAEGVAANAAR